KPPVPQSVVFRQILVPVPPPADKEGNHRCPEAMRLYALEDIMQVGPIIVLSRVAWIVAGRDARSAGIIVEERFLPEYVCAGAAPHTFLAHDCSQLNDRKALLFTRS